MQNTPQAGIAQAVETKRKSGGRARSISRLLPEVRKSIPSLFDRHVPAERVGEQFSVSKTDVLEELIRDTRRRIGIVPGPARLEAVRRVA